MRKSGQRKEMGVGSLFKYDEQKDFECIQMCDQESQKDEQNLTVVEEDVMQLTLENEETLFDFDQDHQTPNISKIIFKELAPKVSPVLFEFLFRFLVKFEKFITYITEKLLTIFQ
jgi:hypothetical protein